MRKRFALCVGINDYPGAASDLSGCVNDAHDWQATLLERGYDVQTLLDGEATKANIIRGIRERLSHLRARDRFVLCFSGHGTWVPEINGDELDKRDEALCCFDYNDGGLLIDDELYGIFRDRLSSSRVTVVSDSCHSGTVSRFVAEPGIQKTAKFIPPPVYSDISKTLAASMEANLPASKPRPGSVLVSGCADHEYSYDASFDGRPNGAMTYFLRKALDEAPSQRVKDVYAKLQGSLPSAEYPQTPQLTAGPYQRHTLLL